MTVLLIDDRGKVWDARSRALRSRLRASVGDGEFREFAILNLGFVGLVVSRKSMGIQLRPALVKPAALGELYLRLHQAAPERVVVKWYSGRWQHDIMGWHRDGWRRITSLLESPEYPARRFLRRTIPAGRLTAENPLRQVLEDASRLASIAASPAQMLPAPLSDRYILLTQDDDRELRVCDFGSALMSRSPQWQRQARGRRIDDLPDWHYGRWVTDAYREVGQAGRPLLEEVSAVIEWPGLGKLSHAYWRLIVPRAGAGERTRLLGLTLDNAGIGVRKVG